MCILLGVHQQDITAAPTPVSHLDTDINCKQTQLV